ncbi:MAG: hypothetical protein JNK04_22715 [Myxococcales bacterium]|nr:hypothetical protein [Myxococcales bacterium]
MKAVALVFLLSVLACGTGTGGTGASTAGGASAGGGGEGPLDGGAGGNGLPLVCVDDGFCDLPGGEQCQQCNDCFVMSPACGNCFGDAECNLEDDACTCPDCAGSPECTACTVDGICDHAVEGCACADCSETGWCT